MNPQLIAAFHAHDSFEDILASSGLDRSEFERLTIQAIRVIHPQSKQDQPSEPSEPSETIKDNPRNLSDEQLHFVRKAACGNSLFLTAPAGYGKSYAIQEAVLQLRKIHDVHLDKKVPSAVAICASTGKAASLIKGRTIHSYLGIGLAKQSAELLYEKLVSQYKNKHKYAELKNLKTLVIDEISMINDELLDKISSYLSLIKRCAIPFGGVQMIFVGDLHQLAPINGKYFIRSDSYRELEPTVLHLTKCFRQSDPVFEKILAEARVGALSESSFDVLMEQNSIDPNLFPGMRPTIICSINRDVDAINQRELNKFDTERHVYKIKPIANNSRKIDTAAKLEAIPESLELAIGVQIMITTNIAMGIGELIANGTQGTVISMHENHIVCSLIGFKHPVKIGMQKVLDPDCVDEQKAPVYLFEYLPVRLGFATSIHRAQGMTCDLLEVDLNRVFAAGQGYVAISRVRSLAGLKIVGLKRSAFIADSEVIDFYKQQ